MIKPEARKAEGSELEWSTNSATRGVDVWSEGNGGTWREKRNMNEKGGIRGRYASRDQTFERWCAQSYRAGDLRC